MSHHLRKTFARAVRHRFDSSRETRLLLKVTHRLFNRRDQHRETFFDGFGVSGEV